MIRRLVGWFRRAPKTEPDSIEWIPCPDVDALPDDAESDAPLPPAALAVLRAHIAPPASVHVAEIPEAISLIGVTRYRVHRIVPGTIYQAYAGEDGVKALEAWEAYQHSKLPGDFWFFDSHAPHGHRGTFSRSET